MLLLERDLYWNLNEFVRRQARFTRSAELLPFGWEYWDIDVAASASDLSTRIDVSRDSGAEIFAEWLEAHITAWEDYWSSAHAGTGPLKVRKLA